MKIVVLFWLSVFLGSPVHAQPQDAPPETRGLRYDVFLKSLKERFEKSATRLNADRVAKVSELSVSALKEESPWSIQSRIQAMPFATSSDTGLNHTGTTELAYRTRSGTEATFGGTAIVYSKPSAIRRSTVTAYATYGRDVIGGGRESLLNLEAEVQQMNTQNAVLDSNKRLLDQRISIVERATILFADHCKLSDLRRITEGIQLSLETGRQKFATKTGTAKEYLILKEVANTFLQQIENMRQRISETEYMLSRIDESIGESARELTTSGADCSSAEPSALKVKSPSLESLRSMADRLPIATELNLQKQISIKDLRIAKAVRRAKLVPFIGVESQTNLNTSSESTQGLIVGINFRYEFPGGDNTMNERSILERTNLAQSRLRVQMNDSLYMFRGIYRELEQQTTILGMVDASIVNSRRLLKLLDTQQAIGIADATSASSAYLNYAEGLIARREVWRNTQTSLEKIAIYKALEAPAE